MWPAMIFCPQMLIISLTFAAFSIEYSSSDRLAVTITLFLTAVAFKLVVKQSLPTISYLTYLVSNIALYSIVYSPMGRQTYHHCIIAPGCIGSYETIPYTLSATLSILVINNASSATSLQHFQKSLKPAWTGHIVYAMLAMVMLYSWLQPEGFHCTHQKWLKKLFNIKLVYNIQHLSTMSNINYWNYYVWTDVSFVQYPFSFPSTTSFIR